ncbi:MAG: helix-turn-helix domain-containing protein [Spirochaetaceae bacterium]
MDKPRVGRTLQLRLSLEDAALESEIRRALSGEAAFELLGPEDAADPGEPLLVLSEAQRRENPLTPRETEVLEAVADGFSNREIANVLGMSENTVKFHLSSIYEKLDADNRTDAVLAGIRLGFVVV